jgi:UDP-N-acetylmuramyl pentapeptide phosphotransferase/UDP-N-acetylglucosamine-1-phosphate transferase
MGSDGVDGLKRILRVIAVVVLLVVAALAGSHARREAMTGGLPTRVTEAVAGRPVVASVGGSATTTTDA